MKKHVLPLVLVSAAVLAGLYFFVGTGGNNETVGTPTPPQCRELSSEELEAVVGGFMKKQGYENWELRTVSPLLCEDDAGIRNMVVDAVINKGLATQYSKTVRLQMRSTVGEVRIYEVVLTRPA